MAVRTYEGSVDVAFEKGDPGSALVPGSFIFVSFEIVLVVLC